MISSYSEIEEKMSEYEDQLKSLQKKNGKGKKVTAKYSYLTQLIKVHRYALENHIALYSKTDYLAEALWMISSLESKKASAETIEQEKYLEIMEKKIWDRIGDKDYRGYLHLLKKYYDEEDVTEEQKKIKRNIIDLRLNIYGKTNDSKAYNNWINVLQVCQNSVLNGVNEFRDKEKTKLTNDEIKYLRDMSEVSQYVISNSTGNISSMSRNYAASIKKIIFLGIAILMVFIAGSIFSNEITNGSMRLTVSMSSSRTKIIISKYLSILVIGFTFTIVGFFIAILYLKTLFAEYPIYDYVGICGTDIFIIDGIIFEFLKWVLELMQIIICINIAFIISIITNSSTIGVLISLLYRFSSSIVLTFVDNSLMNINWLNYITIQKLGNMDVFFPYTIENIRKFMESDKSSIEVMNTSIGFNIVYFMFLCLVTVGISVEIFRNREL